ncbi:hypothetical protein CRG98_021245 [Punica granatum]|uniref:Uncharacterized protein n=1 Tax=Punica granatum TaxID=22663 RepID=A0A2I0JR34_PUNGR|nr:hypothetical protein CRG98_021245 [Punica granatum]
MRAPTRVHIRVHTAATICDWARLFATGRDCSRPGATVRDWMRLLSVANNSRHLRQLTSRVWWVRLNNEIEIPGGDATSDQQDAYDQWSVDDTKVRCYMLAYMSNELQKQHDNRKSSREILKNLKELYGENSMTAQYEISKELFRARMLEGTEVAAHVQKMIGLIQQLEKLEF